MLRLLCFVFFAIGSCNAVSNSMQEKRKLMDDIEQLQALSNVMAAGGDDFLDIASFTTAAQGAALIQVLQGVKELVTRVIQGIRENSAVYSGADLHDDKVDTIPENAKQGNMRKESTDLTI